MRSEQAYAASTLGELAQLQADLPTLATRPTGRRHGLAPGWRGFTARWSAPVGTELTMAELIAHLAPEIQARGYDLTQRADDRLRFERRRRPAWTFAVAILIPVFGWFALLLQGPRADHDRRRRRPTAGPVSSPAASRRSRSAARLRNWKSNVARRSTGGVSGDRRTKL